MKKLRNMLCSGIASAMLLSALPVHAANMVTTTDGHGESETVEETVRFINEHNDWGIVKANGSVQVGSQTVDLLVTFQSPEAAMANFKNKYGDELKQIQRDHGWVMLNDENYHEYYQRFLHKVISTFLMKRSIPFMGSSISMKTKIKIKK